MRPARLAALGLLAALAVAGCGKKGPPLAPFVRIPAGVEKIAASRFGNDVYVTLTVPTANIDTSLPIDLTRIDVYGYTGRVAPTRCPLARARHRRRFDSGGAATGRCRQPPVAATSDRQGRNRRRARDDRRSADGRRPRSGPPPDRRSAIRRVDDGARAPRRRPCSSGSISPSASVSEDRPGPSGAQTELVLTNVPDPPTEPRATYAPASLSLTWEPSGGLVGFLLDRALPAEPSPYDTAQPVTPATPVVDSSVPPGPTTYSVYRAARARSVPAASGRKPGVERSSADGDRILRRSP